jgi:hypothetical protein
MLVVTRADVKPYAIPRYRLAEPPVIPIDIPRPLGSVAQRIVRPPSKHLIEQPTLPETWRAEPKP